LWHGCSLDRDDTGAIAVQAGRWWHVDQHGCAGSCRQCQVV